jgi:ribosomal protein S18 acetylase RimI-like enzyme
MMATCEDEVVGMLVAFPMEPSDETDDAIDPVLLPYYRLEETGSYYICGVAVLPGFRGKGIGSRFMAMAEKHALEKGLEKTSLIVFEKNVPARALYERLGYQEQKREQVVSHELIRFTGDALLMVKQLANKSTS